MAEQVQKMFRVSFSDAWYQLSKGEADSLLKKVNDARANVGGKSVTLCDSSWASEEWQFFGIETYSNIEAVQRNAELLKELEWFRYVKSSILLGTATSV